MKSIEDRAAELYPRPEVSVEGTGRATRLIESLRSAYILGATSQTEALCERILREANHNMVYAKEGAHASEELFLRKGTLELILKGVRE